MAAAGVNRAGGMIVIPIMSVAGGDTRSGVDSSSGSVNVAGMSAIVSAAGNISIAAIVTGIIMTVVVLARVVLALMDPVDPARMATIATNKKRPAG
jgi:hypothetical protein